MKRSALPIAAALLALAGCGGEPAAPAGSAATQSAASAFHLAITARDFGFEVPETVPAGLVETQLESTGSQPHHALIYKLNDDVSYEQFVKAVLKEEANVPKLAVRRGGVSPARTEGKSEIYKEDDPYEPGTYAVLCFIRDPETAKSHYELGMMARFTVE